MGEEGAVGGFAGVKPELEEVMTETEDTMESVAVWVETGGTATYDTLRLAVAQGAAGGKGSWRDG